MGVYIHYEAKLATTKIIPELLDKFEVAGKAYGWPATRIDKVISGLMPGSVSIGDGPTKFGNLKLVENHVRGVILKAPDSGDFQLSFTKEGDILDYADISFHFDESQRNGEVVYMPMGQWMNVTGAMDTHRKVCKILKAIETGFKFTKWDVNDSTGYYESACEEQLHSDHLLMGAFRDMMSSPASAEAFLKATGVVSKDAKVTPVKPEPAKPAPKRDRAARAN